MRWEKFMESIAEITDCGPEPKGKITFGMSRRGWVIII
jgi:hypothetical protein